jgi:hypothetical protein
MSETYPNVNIQLIPGQALFGLDLRQQLILAQGTSSGSFTSGNLITNVPTSIDELKALCGAGSQAYLAIKAFREVNKLSPLSAIIVSDNASGVAATGSIALTTSGIKNGKAVFIIGSGYLNRYEIDVLSTATATSIGDTLAALVNADENSPVTASNTTGTITFTAKNKGTEANQFSIYAESLPSGVNATITAFSGGATDPVITNVLNKIKEARYDIATQKCFLTEVKNNLEAKFNTINQTLESYAVITQVNSYADAQTALTNLASKVINNVFIKVANETNIKGSSILELPIVLSARLLATDSLRLIAESPIASFMQGTNVSGGLNKVAVPFHSVKLLNVSKIPVGLNWSSEEKTGIENLGGSVLAMDDSNLNLITRVRFMTCYKKANITNDGQTFINLNKFLNSAMVKEYLYKQWKKTYAQAVLINGTPPTTVNDVIYVNKKSAKLFITSLFKEMSNLGIVDFDDGALLTEFESNLIININTATNTMTGAASYKNMGQLENIQFNLTANS